DHALRAEGEARRAYYLRSAQAYRRAAALQPATYPLINAATLSLLSGDRAQAEEIAREVLARIAAEPEEPETPYYRAATEAEALLLLGRREEARAALEAAVAAAPRAWEDHGSTLRQFVAIEAALGGDLAWLDLLRPPLSLSWVGPGGDREMPGVADLIAGAVEQKRIGFAFGPLATEADLAVAEALLAHDVTLHLVLPAVPPTGESAEAVLSGAESIMQMRPLDGPPDLRRTLLARRIARGAARLNAERLMSEAVELQVIASDAAEEGEV